MATPNQLDVHFLFAKWDYEFSIDKLNALVIGWIATGLDVSEINDWLCAGCWNPATAKTWIACNRTHRHASADCNAYDRMISGIASGEAMELACRGELAVETIVDCVPQ